MNRSVFCRVSVILFCIGGITGVTPGFTCADACSMERQNRTSHEGLHPSCQVAGEPQDPSEEGPAGDLEGELNALIEELKKLERDARKMFEEEVLPRIRKEIQRLREKLREFDLEEKQPETRET